MNNEDKLQKLLEEAIKTKKIDLDDLDDFDLNYEESNKIYSLLAEKNVEIILEKIESNQPVVK